MSVLTRVIEFSSLADCKTTASNDKHFLDIDQVLASSNDTALKVGLGVWRNLGLVRRVSNLEAVD